MDAGVGGTSTAAPDVATRLLTKPVNTEGPHVNLSMMDVQSAKTLHMDAGVGGNAAPGVATRLLIAPVKDTDPPLALVTDIEGPHVNLMGKSFLSARYEVMPI